MKLTYSIPDKLWWIKDFLNFDMYKGIHNAVINERKKINLTTAKGTWHKDLINNIEAPMRVEVSNYQPFENLKTLIKHNMHFKLKNVKKMTTTIHYMEKGAGINWHDDSEKWKYGATYYLNHKWNSQWGGELMFTNKNGHGFIPPVGNSLVLIKSPLSHKVNTVLTSIMPRISIQIFMS